LLQQAFQLQTKISIPFFFEYIYLKLFSILYAAVFRRCDDDEGVSTSLTDISEH